MISGNSQAEEITNFFYFPDHELQYWHVNRKHAPVTVNLNPRPHDFTLLSRTHKWWRASVVADLWLQGILSNSIWSYGDQSIEDTWENNPIDVSGVEGLETQIHEFVNQSPYRCDTLTTDQHNSHHVLVAEQFSNSYLHLVMETFFDADRSNGTFLTEKTFKPIKHGQPFIIIGPPGSLKKLRELGYRTFDNVIDPEYDTIIDNTQRWHCIRKLIKKLFRGDLHLLYTQCREDIQHNQLHFVSSKHARLKQLEEQLNAS
jgi:hypothetical protein